MLTARHWPAPMDPELKKSLLAIPGVAVRGTLLIAVEDVAEVVAGVLGAPGVSVVSNAARPTLAPVPTAFPWQNEGAEQLASGRKQGLFWTCGVGKSAALLMAARTVGAQQVLILTRAMGRDVYARDSTWCWPNVRVGIVVGRAGTGAGAAYVRQRADAALESRRRSGAQVHVYATAEAARHEGCTVVVVGYEVLDAHIDQLASLRWDILIADESHMIKGRSSARTLAAHKLRGVPLRWIATATPVRNRLPDLWPQWYLACPALGSSWKFLHRYCDAKPGRYGGLDTTGLSHVDELRARLQRVFDFRSRSTLAHLLPAKQRTILRVPNEAETFGRRSYIEDAIADAADVKFHDVCGRVVEAASGGEKVILVGNRRAWAHRAAALIDREAKRMRQSLWLRILSGDVDVPRRQALAAEFLRAPAPAVAVATIDAISECIDLQDADRMVVAALPYTPGQLIQIEGRVHRPGQKRPVTIDYVIAEGTIDEEIEDLLLSKLAAVERAGAHTEDNALRLPAENECSEALSAWLHQRAEAAGAA